MDISAWLDEVNAASAAGVPAPAYPGSLTQAPASAPVQSTQSILQSSAPTATQGSVPQSVLNYDPWANMGYGAPVQDYWQQYVQKNPLGIDWSTWTPPTGDIGAGGKEFVPGVGPVGFDQSDVTRMMLNEGLGLDYYETRPFGQKTDEELIKKLQGGKDSVKRVDKQYMNPNTWRRDLITTYGLDETGGLKEISSDWDTTNISSRNFAERALGDNVGLMGPIGTVLGTVLGAVIGNVPGAALGASAGNLVGNGMAKQGMSYEDMLTQSAIAGAATYGAGTAGLLAGEAASGLGSTASGAAQGAATGATGAGINSLGQAVQTGDYSGILPAVGIGTALGGLAGGVGGYMAPAGDASPAYTQLTQEGGLNPATQNLSNVLSDTVGSGGVSLAGDATLFNVDPSLAYSPISNLGGVGTGLSTTPVNTDLLSPPTPTLIGGHNPLQPTPPTYGLAPELSPIIPGEFPTINSMPEPFSVDSIDRAFMSGESGIEGYSPELVDTLTGGGTNMRGWSINDAGEFVPPPTYTLAPELGPIWADPTLEYTPVSPITDFTMGNIPTNTGYDWDKLLDSLGGLGGTQTAAMPGAFPTGREFNGDSSAYVEPPMKSGKGSGSKGLSAEEYEKLYNGTSFMPDTKEIERFNKQGLYYT
jgi:hypothetical protein